MTIIETIARVATEVERRGHRDLAARLDRVGAALERRAAEKPSADEVEQTLAKLKQWASRHGMHVDGQWRPTSPVWSLKGHKHVGVSVSFPEKGYYGYNLHPHPGAKQVNQKLWDKASTLDELLHKLEQHLKLYA